MKENKSLINDQINLDIVPKKTFIQRLFALRSVLVFLILVSSLLTFFSKSYPYFSFDLLITKTLQQFNSDWFTYLMIFVSKMGNASTGAVSLLLIFLLLTYLKRISEAIILAISTIGIFLISGMLKTFVERPRPDPSLIVQIGEYSHFDSFPSGHVFFAMGFYGMILLLAYIELKKGFFRSMIIAFCIFFIILMGISRIYLGAHWFSDTLGSYLIGTIWLYLMSSTFKKLKKR